MFIFLSYGHDEFKSIAIRLKQDLESVGHSVWFDENKLPGGSDWEYYIERGLLQTMHERGKLIILMTCYSMREPDGFCLNEIAFARSNHIPVIAVRVEDFTPPEQFHPFIDMVYTGSEDTFHDRYEAALQEILQAINK